MADSTVYRTGVLALPGFEFSAVLCEALGFSLRSCRKLKEQPQGSAKAFAEGAEKVQTRTPAFYNDLMLYTHLS